MCEAVKQGVLAGGDCRKQAMRSAAVFGMRVVTATKQHLATGAAMGCCSLEVLAATDGFRCDAEMPKVMPWPSSGGMLY